MGIQHYKGLFSIMISWLLWTILLNEMTIKIHGATEETQLAKQFQDLFLPTSPMLQDRQLSSVPIIDITAVTRLIKKNELYFSLNKNHKEAVQALMMIVKDSAASSEEVLDLLMKLRGHSDLNLRVWHTATMMLAQTDKRLLRIPKPTLFQISPDLFVPSTTREYAYTQFELPQDKRTCTILDSTVGEVNGIENRLWYFREDIMLNSAHWYYHLQYPFNGTTKVDRQGEMFYAIHHNIMARLVLDSCIMGATNHGNRYHAERLSNGMSKITPYEIKRGRPLIVEEGYYTNLQDSVSGLSWASRLPGSEIKDSFYAEHGIPRFDLPISNFLSDYFSLEEALENGFMVAENGTKFTLKSSTGTDLFGCAAEANSFTINQKYGNKWFGFHNSGHCLTAFVHDPARQANKTRLGVIGESATSMRDPWFYRWHQLVDDLFAKQKGLLPPYQPHKGEFPLVWNGVQFKGVSVKMLEPNAPNNTLETFWNHMELPLSHGLDFFRNAKGKVYICAKHLDHQDFNINLLIKVDPSLNGRKGTVRVFIAPRFDENGKRFPFVEQRRLFFPILMFVTTLQGGNNDIVRSSSNSGLTTTWGMGQGGDLTGVKTKPYCGCAWPHHLLLPKGTPHGMIFDIFAMITDYTVDHVRDETSRDDTIECKISTFYCGIPGGKYPDSRPLGYPFDRSPFKPRKTNSPVETLEEFSQQIPNSAIAVVKIVHKDIVGSTRNRDLGWSESNVKRAENHTFGKTRYSVKVKVKITVEGH